MGLETGEFAGVGLGFSGWGSFGKPVTGGVVSGLGVDTCEGVGEGTGGATQVISESFHRRSAVGIHFVFLFPFSRETTFFKESFFKYSQNFFPAVSSMGLGQNCTW